MENKGSNLFLTVYIICATVSMILVILRAYKIIDCSYVVCLSPLLLIIIISGILILMMAKGVIDNEQHKDQDKSQSGQ